jgi:hypothetical protein
MMPIRTARAWLVTILVLVLGMAFSFEASAEKKIDWSEYMEKPGDTVPGFSKAAAKQKKTAKVSKKASKKASRRASKKARSAKRAKARAAKSKSKGRVAARSSKSRRRR